MEKNNLKLIFEMWKSSLRSKDRKTSISKTNFEELFEQWKNSGGTFETLYEEWLPKAIKAHQPSPAVITNTFKKVKQYKTGHWNNQYDFATAWNKEIEEIGKETFFEFFKPSDIEVDDTPKVYGNMTAKEYRAQRNHADQYPILDTTELENRLKNNQYNLDIEDLLKNVLGDQSETKS